MAKQLLEINKFMNGTVTTPDASDTPEQSATYSLNLDCVNKDGALQGAPTNTTVTCRVTEDNDLVTATVDIDKARVIKSVDSSGNDPFIRLNHFNIIYSTFSKKHASFGAVRRSSYELKLCDAMSFCARSRYWFIFP